MSIPLLSKSVVESGVLEEGNQGSLLASGPGERSAEPVAEGEGSSSSFFVKPSSSRKRGGSRSGGGSSVTDDRDTILEISSDEDSISVSAVDSFYVAEEGSDASPPEKALYLRAGSQASSVSRKRDKSGSVSGDSDRTTGFYVGRRREVERLNEAKSASLKLDRERIIRSWSHIELFKKSRINLNEIKSKLEDISSEELVRRGSSNMDEVVRIARSSSNLKGTLQKGLKTSAAVTYGILAVLRERMSLSQDESHLEEIRVLKKEVSSLRVRLEDEVEAERRKALQAAGEAEAYRSQLEALKRETTGRESVKRSPSKRVPSAKLRAASRVITSDSEYMEVEEENRVVLDSPEKWPVAKIPIGGGVRIVHDDPEVNRAIYEERKRIQREKDKNKGRKEKPLGSSPGPSAPGSSLRGDSPGALAELVRKIVSEEVGRALGKPPGREKEKPRIKSVEIIEPAGGERSSSFRGAPGGEGKSPLSLPSTPGKAKLREDGHWSLVAKRKPKRGTASTPSTPKQGAKSSEKETTVISRRRAPRSAVVQISCRGEVSYAEAMKFAKQNIKVEEFGIDDLRPRKARTGALLLEIPGVEGSKKADALANKMRQIFSGQENILVSRPEKMAEVRIRDLEESVSVEEIVSELCSLTKCNPSSIKVGEISFAPNGMAVTLVRCPLVVANSLIRDRRIKIGWARCRIELLPERPLHCYRCLEIGHVRSQCRSEKDRSETCYRCGESGHPAKGCLQEVRCVICADRGLKANHRMGGPACKPDIRRGKVSTGLPSSGRPVAVSMDIDGPMTSRGAGKPVEVPTMKDPSSSRPVEMDIDESREAAGDSRTGSQDAQASTVADWPVSGTDWEHGGREAAQAQSKVEQVGGTLTEQDDK
ncbi:PREDICTED: uncharacterized protein LOC108781200 [Cyphomyrmex costatus]|uniref:uncharacterized protein LOC108781200 n=1 Tax=Cyphomyrmex costatus TaxID=456900 RepID=UPI00085234D9|nr:PREDICTED: uncharacterized protein LOC108781200 [Cyphomyrmex costatus]